MSEVGKASRIKKVCKCSLADDCHNGGGYSS